MNGPGFRTICGLLLLAAAIGAPGGAGAALPSGADYQIESSVLDGGGGATVSGGGYAVKGSVSQPHMPPNLGNTGGGEYSNRVGFNNPPHLTYQGSLDAVLTLASGDMRVTLPSGSVSKERFDITLNRDPVTNPLAVNPTKITAASDKMVYNDGGWSQLYSNNLSEMAIFDEQSFQTGTLGKRGVLAMRYRDDDDDGIMDGSEPPVRVNTLSAWILDESVDSWVQIPGTGGDRQTKTLTVLFGQPGVYAMIGAQELTVKNVKAYPVPYRPNGPQAGDGDGQTGTDGKGITFDNLPQTGNIKIYTLDGRLVKGIEIPETLAIQKVVWDTRTSSGDKAASGVYIWRISAGSNSKTGKLMIIR